ncbi:hypothetical protein [Methylobacterium sp. NEAU K]|uniref:hypothetical protein n=1 Tax=Methylobacterium sp. NEAU K TaxID=3064946 RepID=UPI002735D37C|nr:hypothetical protein [Methylobacterium sp. NEAU K]MDP4004152.1 hypothetical protein [Methylobacterium sp. NEAU K]
MFLISRFVQFFAGGGENASRTSDDIERREESTGENRFVEARSFDENYRDATGILKARMDKRFPDNYRARLGTDGSGTYDHGQDRAAAIDTMSTAIATALRKGATVPQAAAVGAASVGI